MTWSRSRLCLGGDFRANGFAKRGLAAKEMFHPRHIEKKPVRGIECDERGEAVAPIGDLFEQCMIARVIGFDHLQHRDHRARIGKRHAGFQAKAGGAPVRRINPQRVVVLDGNDKRLIRRGGILPSQPVGRQARQPDRNDPPRFWKAGIRKKIHRRNSIP